MTKPSEPVPDVAHCGHGGLHSRGLTLEGEMHGS
jgi:hypothetical protein